MSNKTIQSSASSQPASQTAASAQPTGSRSNGELEAEDLELRSELAAPDDSQIDYSDLPELTDQQLSEFVHGPWTPLVERALTLRLDSEVYEWLQHAGPEYTKTINLVLKREAQRAKRSSQKLGSTLSQAS